MTEEPGKDLSGKVALVTGAGIGIGRAIALALLEAGADVAATYFTHAADEIAQRASELGRAVFLREVDVSDSSAVERAMVDATTALGGLDIVVANAGGLVSRVPLTEMSDEHWHKVIDINLSSAFYLARSASAHMNHGGRLIFVSSMAAFTGGSGGAGAYAAAKAGLTGLTGALAKELAPQSITVNAVAPGMILETPFHETFTPIEAQQATAARLPAGRAGTPTDVSDLVLYLSSAGASFMTGEVIQLNGGQHLV